MGKKQIGKPRKQKSKNVTNDTTPIEPLRFYFDFSNPHWMCSVEVNEFTNFLENEQACLKTHHALFYKIIPKILSEIDQIIAYPGSYKYSHCHSIKGHKRNIVSNIYREIYKHELDDEVNVFQFSFSIEARLIAVLDGANKKIKPIFIDQHHLIFPDKHYNLKDVDSFSYCLVCNHK